MDAILRDLTEPQRAAVTHIEGPLLILAGPGSGKTRVITHRIAHLISQGVAPWNITALTFTNKAAEEMRQRVDRLAPGQPVWIGTFHRFCARLLRQYATLVGLRENYSIIDSSESKQAVRRAIEAANVSLSHHTPDKIAAAIGRFKNRLVPPEALEDVPLHSNDYVASRVYAVYQQQLLTANAVDFDDLLLHSAILLKDNAELRGELDAKHRFIMVDEYQDTNIAQYAIVRGLSVRQPNLAVTGDPDQSIYGWRGADISNILGFEKDYPQVRLVRLEENYRSTPEILHLADVLIRNNKRRKDKDLFTHNSSGEPAVMRIYNTGYEEADDIAEQVASGVMAGTMRPRDVAVFCRMNALTRSLEHAFRSRGIPYQIVNGLEFYQRKEIKDLLSYLHLINNPAHDMALQRIINTPTRGIGAKTIKLLLQHANAHRIPILEAAREAKQISGLAARSAKKVLEFVSLFDRLQTKATASLTELLKFTIAETGYEKYLEAMVDESDNDRLANVNELITSAVEFDRQFPEQGSLEAFLEQVALVSDTDAFEATDDRVTLMTLHAAKGLEFPHVFIIAVENRLLPHERSMESDAQLEEERRLLFVGITRAEKTLQLSCVKNRVFRGDSRPAAPSSFLMELPRDTMKIIDNADPAAHRFGPVGYDELDQSHDYPESWDITPDMDTDDDFSQLRELPEPTNYQLPDELQLPEKLQAKQRAFQSGVTTAANLLSQQRQPGDSDLGGTAERFRVGMLVEHPKYGHGRITKLTGIGIKKTARVEFEKGESESFRLEFSPLKPAE